MAANIEAELNDLRMSEKVRPLFEAVKRHVADNVDPMYPEFLRLGKDRADSAVKAPCRKSTRT